jgi:hypothetical protein
MPAKPSIVFAHGLWADGSCYSSRSPISHGGAPSAAATVIVPALGPRRAGAAPPLRESGCSADPDYPGRPLVGLHGLVGMTAADAQESGGLSHGKDGRQTARTPGPPGLMAR